LFIVQPVHPEQDPGSGILIIIGLIASTELINDKKLTNKRQETLAKTVSQRLPVQGIMKLAIATAISILPPVGGHFSVPVMLININVMLNKRRAA
jgi:hypothetical protein